MSRTWCWKPSLCVDPGGREGAGASQELSQRGKSAPILPKLPACCLKWAGPVPLEVCLLAASPPPSHPLVQRLNAEGSHMVLCGHIFPSTVSSWCECRAWLPSVSCPSPPPLPPPPQPAQKVAGCGGQAHGVGEPCRVGASEFFRNPHPHTLTQKLLK